MGAIGTFLANLVPYIFIGVVGSLALILCALWGYFYITDGEHPSKPLRALIVLAGWLFVAFIAVIVAFNL